MTRGGWTEDNHQGQVPLLGGGLMALWVLKLGGMRNGERRGTGRLVVGRVEVPQNEWLRGPLQLDSSSQLTRPFIFLTFGPFLILLGWWFLISLLT